MTMTRVKRPTLADLDLSIGKRTRLHRLLYKYGPGNGTLLLLPIDQGLEHGPRDFFVNPDAKDPEFQLRLAKEGGFSGIVFQIGIAEKYMNNYAGEVPLVLKLNGKTEIPADKAPISPLHSPPSKTPCGWAPTPWATRSTSARRCRRKTSSSCAGCARMPSAMACR